VLEVCCFFSASYCSQGKEHRFHKCFTFSEAGLRIAAMTRCFISLMQGLLALQDYAPSPRLCSLASDRWNLHVKYRPFYYRGCIQAAEGVIAEL
jgi:hypothetical protein